MKINITIGYFTLIAVTSLFGQIPTEQQSFPPYFITSRSINFSIEDTLLSMLLLTKQTGEIRFVEENNFRNSSYSIFRFIGKGRKKVTYKDTIVASEQKVLNLKSYFHPLNQDSTKFINGYDFEYDWSPHYGYDIYYSYLLNGIGASNLYKSDRDSVIRIVVPELGIDKETHEIYEVDINTSDIKIYYVKAAHTHKGQFDILEKDSCFVTKPKQIKMFYEEFNKFNFGNDSYFIKIDGSTHYFIEYKTKNEYYAFMRPNVDFYGKPPDNEFPWMLFNLYMRNRTKK